MRNTYENRGNVTAIFINYKGLVTECYISTNKLQKAMEFDGRWYGKKDHNTVYVYGSTTKGKRKTVKLHKWISDETNLDIDHKNHNGLDNTDENLQIMTHSGNLQNRLGANKSSKSGVRGVYWCTVHNKWVGEINLQRKRIWSGRFTTLDEAKMAIEYARKLNVPYA